MTGGNDFATQLGTIRGSRAAARAYINDLLDDPDSYKIIAEVQEDRLARGYEKFQDLMWRWDQQRLLGELIEELADALNYASVMFAKEAERGQ